MPRLLSAQPAFATPRRDFATTVTRRVPMALGPVGLALGCLMAPKLFLLALAVFGGLTLVVRRMVRV